MAKKEKIIAKTHMKKARGLVAAGGSIEAQTFLLKKSSAVDTLVDAQKAVYSIQISQ